MTSQGLRGVTGLDDESSFSDIFMMAASVLQHATQVYFAEPAVLHAFQQVGGQLQFPCPPQWPLSCRQNRLASSSSFVRQPNAANEPRAFRIAWRVGSIRLLAHVVQMPDDVRS